MTICFNLPGYGPSSNPTKKGFSLAKMAETFNKLMIHFQYPEYVIQGGDWGSLTGRQMAMKYPSHCKAIHLNFLLMLGTPRMTRSPFAWFKGVTLIEPIFLYEKSAIEGSKKFSEEESGYAVYLSENLFDFGKFRETAILGLFIVAFVHWIVGLD